MVVLSCAPSALAHRRRGAALFEDRGEGVVPAQGHRDLRGSQSGPEDAVEEHRESPELIGICPNELELVRNSFGGAKAIV